MSSLRLGHGQTLLIFLATCSLATFAQEIVASPSSLDFGVVRFGQPQVRSIELRNTGTATTIVRTGIVSDAMTVVSPSTQHFSVAPQATVVVQVRFSPPSAAAFDGVLTISCPDCSEKVVSIPLNGRAVAPGPGTLDVFPSDLDFSIVPIGGSKTLEVTLQNLSTADLTLKVTATGMGFTVSDAVFMLRPVESRVLKLEFRPTTPVQETGTLSIASDSPDKKMIALSVRGSGVVPSATAPLPRVVTGGILSAASLTSPVSPGQIATVFGTEFSARTSNASGTPLPNRLGGTELLFGGRMAPIFNVAPSQITFQVPYEAAEGTTEVVVLRDGIAGTPVSVIVVESSPELFTYSPVPNESYPHVVHLDGSLVGPVNPAGAGESVIAYLTGLGPVVNVPPTGEATPAEALSSAVSLPEVTLGVMPVTVASAALTPGTIGIAQVSLALPAVVPIGGCLPLVLRTRGFTSFARNLATAPGGCMGTTGAKLSLAVSSLDFGSVPIGQATDRAIALYNAGGSPLSILGLSVSGGFSAVTAAASFNIAPGESYLLTLRFRPTSSGIDAKTLSILSSDVNSPSLVTLKGSGILAAESQALFASSGDLDFGIVTVGQAKDLVVNVINRSELPLDVKGEMIVGSTIVEIASLTIRPGEAAPIGVRFAPTSSSSFKGSLNISSTTGNITILINGKGTEPSRPLL